MDSSDTIRRQDYSVGVEQAAARIEQARDALKTLFNNVVDLSSSQIEGLCHPDSLLAIQTLMEYSIQDLQLPMASLEIECQLLSPNRSPMAPRRAISDASNASTWSSTTLEPSPSRMTSNSPFQAEDFSPLRKNHSRHNEHYKSGSQYLSPNINLYGALSVDVDFPALYPQSGGDAALNEQLSNNLAIDPISIPGAPFPNSQQYPDSSPHLPVSDRKHCPTSSTTHEPRQEVSLGTNIGNQGPSVQAHDSSRTYRIKRKPVRSGLAIGHAPAAASPSITFDEEQPHPAATKAKKAEVYCHLCSGESKSYQIKGEFAKHLEYDHAKTLRFFCKHCPFRTFRPPERKKHHTRIHGDDCFGDGTDMMLCYYQREHSSGYLSDPCPICSKLFESHREWLQHHLEHFLNAVCSLAGDIDKSIIDVTCVANQKRNRGSRSEASTPPSSDDQARRHHVKKSPRIAPEYVGQDVNMSHVNLSAEHNMSYSNYSCDNDDFPLDRWLDPSAFDLNWSPGFPSY